MGTLKASSSFEQFQQALHDAAEECPAPCAPKEEARATPVPTVTPVPGQSMSCHTAIPGDRCYTRVKWVMNDGIHSNPTWYNGLDKYSTFEDVQGLLAADPNAECQTPCKLNY